jgi:phosphoribosyl 1,2-cyclic phosphodiesterase
MSWEILKERLGDLGAKRTMITHMNPTMLAKTDDAKAAGVLVAADGLKFEF